MKWLVPLMISLAVTAAAADGPTPTQRIEAFLASPDRNDSAKRWRVLMLAECLESLNEDVLSLFRALRAKGEMPAYSEAWCVQNDFVPWHLRSDGEVG